MSATLLVRMRYYRICHPSNLERRYAHREIRQFCQQQDEDQSLMRAAMHSAMSLHIQTGAYDYRFSGKRSNPIATFDGDFAISSEDDDGISQS
jgi:hypothetical protein